MRREYGGGKLSGGRCAPNRLLDNLNLLISALLYEIKRFEGVAISLVELALEFDLQMRDIEAKRVQ